MGVAGELTTIGLAEVFQNLSFNHLTGTLRLKHGEETAHLAFEGGRIRAIAFNDRKLDYADAVRRAGAADDERIEQAISVKRRRTLKAFLRASGPLDEDRFDAAVAAQVQEEILPLFGWTAGSFAFDEGRVSERRFDKEQRDCSIDLDPMGVAMEAARRHDEWQGIAPYVPSDKEILVMPVGRPDETDADTDRLLDLIDGTQPIGAIIRKARLKKYDVMRIVAQLVELGWLAPATPDVLQELAAQAKAIGEINLAARRLEIALEMDSTHLDARRDLVSVYERAGRKADAARELGTLCSELERRGDVKNAQEALERAALLAPNDLDILEQLFDFHVARGDKARGLRAGRRLAESLAAQGMHEDARPLYERLVRAYDDNEGLREAYALCLLELDESAAAVEQYRWIAERAYEQGEFDRASRRLRRVLELDPECEAAQDLVQRIDSGEAEKRRRKRQRRLIAACIAPVLGLVLWQVGREYVGVGALHEAQHATIGALAGDNSDPARLAAMRRYVEVAHDHAFTRAEVLARESLRTLLVAEVGRIRELCEKSPDAKNITEVEYTRGRAEKLIAGIDAMQLPKDLAEFWQGARTSLVESLESTAEPQSRRESD